MEAIFNHNYAEYYATLLEPFRSESFGPKIATGLLVAALVVLLGFLFSVLSKFTKLKAALKIIRGPRKITGDLEKRVDFQRNFEKIDSALLANKLTSLVWREFRETLLLHERRDDAIENSTRPQNFFNLRNLHVHYDFVRSLPNFFVGIGLLGTFIGLIAALTFSTQSLTQATDQAEIKSALNNLLSTAAAKFYISAAGLLASLILSLCIRFTLKHLHHLVHQINDALEERLLYVSELALADKQLSAQRDSLEELKLFNTNIAMKIGDAVREAVQASHGSLTDKLSEIADTFSRLVDASREGAGMAVDKAMNTALETSLAQASEAIGSVAAELRNLPGALSATAAKIEESGRAATEQQARLAETVQNSVEKIVGKILTNAAEQVTTQIDHSLKGLASTGSALGESAENIGSFLARFGEKGDAFVKSLSDLASENSRIESNLAGISNNLISAAQSVVQASKSADGNINKLIAGIADFSRVATETSRSVQISQESILKTVDTLQKQMAQHMTRFDSVDQKLANVFAQISKHLESQANQMGQQLSQMDKALASAVTQFENLIQDLTETLSQRA